MESIFITKSGTLKREQNTIVFRSKDLPTPRYFPVKEVEDIYIMGSVSFNTALISFLLEEGIPIHTFHREKYLGSFLPVKSKTSSQVYIKQFEHFYNYGKRLYIAKEITLSSAKNLLALLKRYKDAIPQDTIANIQRHISSIEEEKSIEYMRSHEGIIHRIYMSALSEIFRGYGIIFDGRVKYPPGDIINSMLSYGYAILYGKVLTYIWQSNLDPRISFVHEPTFKSYALQLDIADIFKAPIVDSTVLTLASRRQIREEMAYIQEGGTYLNKEGKMLLISSLTEKFSTIYQSQKWKHIIKAEVKKLEKHVLGEKAYKGFVYR